MKNKFKSYWSGCQMLYAIATILDPRCQLDGTDSLMSAIADNLCIDMELTIDDTRKTLENLFVLYEKKYGTGTEQQLTSTSSRITSGPQGSSWSFLKRKEKAALESSSMHWSSLELLKYFKSNFIIDDDKLNILR